MKTISKRWLLITLLALVLTQGGVTAVRALYEPRRIRAPHASVTSLPVELGDWHASEADLGQTGMDEEMLAAVFADDAVTRLFSHPDDQECSVHLAVWHESDAWMPHPPYMCYDAAGFKPGQNQKIPLPGVDYGPVGCTQYTNTSTGQSVVIMYWYQMGDRHYLNRDGAREVRRSFWGDSERPPLVKVLMQIPYRERYKVADESRMGELAAKVYEFVREL